MRLYFLCKFQNSWKSEKCRPEFGHGVQFSFNFNPLNPDLISLSGLDTGAPGRIVDLEN